MSEDPDLLLSKELNRDVLDAWKVPEQKEPIEIEFDTSGLGCIYHEPVDADISDTVPTRIASFANIPGVCYEVLS